MCAGLAMAIPGPRGQKVRLGMEGTQRRQCERASGTMGGSAMGEGQRQDLAFEPDPNLCPQLRHL